MAELAGCVFYSCSSDCSEPFWKRNLELASILIGIIAGYIVSIPFGMVNLSSVGEAGMFQVPEFMHFGIEFEISSCVAIGF